MKRLSFHTIAGLILALLPLIDLGQNGLVNMNREFDLELETKVNLSDSNFHTSVKPYTYSSLSRNGVIQEDHASGFFLNKAVSKSYGKKNGLIILPLISASGTAQMESSTSILPEYGAGAYLKGFIGDKFTVNGFYRYTGLDQPNYIDSSVFNQNTISSIGRVTNPGADMVNVNHWEATLLYNANKYFTFIAGKGNHFFGDGYRSLLLSDNAASYPFLKIESTFWKVKYVNLYSWHNDFRTGSNRNKFSTSHYLSWNITKDINLGLFETVVWQGSDTLHNRGFEVTYMNPAIFYRAPEFSLGSADNSLIGASLKFRIKKNYIFYSQLILDEFYLVEMKAGNKWWANK